MLLISVNISNKSILIDIRETLLKRYSLLRRIDRLILFTRINLSINIINIIIYSIEINKY